MQIGTLTIHPLVLLICGLLIVFFYLAFRRRVTHDGQWELSSGKKQAWTDKCTGTSFASDHRVLMPGELSGRRKKFGKPAWSWPITIVVLAMIVIALRAFGAL